MNRESDLEAMRREIRQISLKIIDLCGKRDHLAKQVGGIKAQRGLPVEDPGVEEELKKEVHRLCRERGLNKDFCAKLLQLLLDESKQVQRNIQGSQR